MRKQDEVSEVRDRFTVGSGDVEQAKEHDSAVRTLAVLAAVFVVVVAGGVLMASCGNQGDSSTHAISSGQVSSLDAGQNTSVASAIATPPPAQGGLSAADSAVLEGLPPDLSVSVPDTLVKPGQAVEFTVEGTTDVAQVELSDGRDEPMPFVRDRGTDTWRTQYRVPLHPRSERFGISVTARTEASRWRRVWVFLHVGQADSAKVVTAPEQDVDDEH